jgi:O-antigen ligase
MPHEPAHRIDDAWSAEDAPPRPWLRRASEIALAWWRPLAIALLWLLLPVVVAGRIDTLGLGGKSFTRNVALFTLAGALLGARDMRLQGSRLTLPLFTYLAVAWLSVEWNGGVRGEVRLLTWTVALFLGVRSLQEARDGRAMLLHWLGAFAVAGVLGEVLANPDILWLSPANRTELHLMHANTLGGSLALLLPIFVAAALDGERRLVGCVYIATALLGILISFSRSGLLCGLLGVAIFALVRQDRPRWRGFAPVFSVGLAAAIGVTALLSVERSEADLQRLRILRTSLHLFSERWLLGIGFGIENLRRVFPARYIELYGSSLFLFHSHNLYVEFLVGTGILGAAAGLWLLASVATVAAARRRAARTAPERGLAAGYVGSLAAFLFLGLTDSPLYHAELLVLLPVIWSLTELPAPRGEATTP